MKKRILTLIMALTLALSLAPAALAAPIDTADSWARDRITAALDKGFVPEDIQASYKNVISREEFCRMAVKWMEYVLDETIDAVLDTDGITVNQNAFSDTSNPDILAAYALGIINGETAPTDTRPGVFNPGGNFTRQQAAVMIMNTCKAIGAYVSNPPAADFADMSLAADWARQGINFARANGIMAGVTTNPPYRFDPNATFTRQESILLFDNIDPSSLPKTPEAPTGPQLTVGSGESVTSATSYIFTPETTGAWMFLTSDNGENDPYLELYNAQSLLIASDDDRGGDSNARIVATLSAGETYRVYAGSYGAITGSYTLTVTPVASLSGSGATVRIPSETGYAFSPDRSGFWSLKTSENGDSDPFLYVYYPDDDYDLSDDAGGNSNAFTVLFLEQGMTYYIVTSFYEPGPTGCTLTISPPKPLDSGGGMFRITEASGFTFMPAQSGTWEMRTDNSGDSDPFIALYDRYGEELAFSDDDGGGLDALVTVSLTAGTLYHVYISSYEEFFVYNADGYCDFTVAKK